MTLSQAGSNTPRGGEILIVDDTPANLKLLSSMLAAQHYHVRLAPNGRLALLNAQSSPPDLILLDIRMPGMSGYEVCTRLKNDSRTRDIPVIFISALDQTEDKIKAFELGGVDYITKPFQIEEVLARIETHLALRAMQRRIEDQNAELAHVNSELTDEIARREEAEQRIIRQNEFLQTVLDSVSHPFYVINADTRVVEMANAAARAGGAVGEIVCHALMYERDQPCERVEHPCPLDKVKRTKQPMVIEDTQIDSEGNKSYYEVRSFPILDQEGEVVQMIEYVVDITTRKELEAQLQEYADHLERMVEEKVRELEQEHAKIIQLDKMASLGQLATGIAHELRQPLTAISFDADYLKAKADVLACDDVPALAGELKDIGAGILESVERGRRIMDHLRTFGRVSEPQVEPVDLRRAIHNSLILVGTRLREHGIDVQLDLDEDLPPILADVHKLEQVFLNLINNAEHALEEKPARDKTLSIRVRCDAAWVEAQVEDNGSGMPEAVREHIFEPFFTTKPAGQGTGLGLSISRDIVAEFGGEIACESVEGEGTTFTLRFPVVEGKGEGERG